MSAGQVSTLLDAVATYLNKDTLSELLTTVNVYLPFGIFILVGAYAFVIFIFGLIGDAFDPDAAFHARGDVSALGGSVGDALRSRRRVGVNKDMTKRQKRADRARAYRSNKLDKTYSFAGKDVNRIGDHGPVQGPSQNQDVKTMKDGN